MCSIRFTSDAAALYETVRARFSWLASSTHDANAVNSARFFMRSTTRSTFTRCSLSVEHTSYQRPNATLKPRLIMCRSARFFFAVRSASATRSALRSVSHSAHVSKPCAISRCVTFINVRCTTAR